MVRRRSRRRKSSYRADSESTEFPPELVIEDLSPRARRLVEGGVIDVALISGSGDNGRITSGDILHAARVMEVEQSVARIEVVNHDPPADSDTTDQETGAGLDPAGVGGNTQPVLGELNEADESEVPDSGGQAEVDEAQVGKDSQPGLVQITDEATTSGASVGGQPVEVPSDPWNAYNGVSEGLSESALPGAEQSWGEAEANIAAIAEEAAAQVYGREVTASAESSTEDVEPEPQPEYLSTLESEDVPSAVVAALSDVEAAVDATPVDESADDEGPLDSADDLGEPQTETIEAVAEPGDEQRKVMMDFGTLEMVDPVSVWEEGAEDFAPWFLAHSRQLGDVLGLEAGLSDARQFNTKSATGVVGRDDTGADVVVVSSQEAEADDSDLGRALGMAASSGAATVALVSAKFNEEQLQALAWLNSQTKSGVQWYAIEMRVVRIADSPAAMLFDLVASPPEA